MKMYFKGDSGIEKPVDANGLEIKEGSVLTYDWFDFENSIEDMRRKFGNMKDWSDEDISTSIHKPTFKVKKNKKGGFFGEGIEEIKTLGYKRLYLHDFRFKYTKIV
jgi:hypothetical protein